MSRIAVALFFCFLSVSSAARVTMRGADVHEDSFNRLKAIDRTRLGHTILNAVAVSVQSGDAISKVLEMLDAIKQNLVEEQAHDDEENKQDTKWCFDTQDLLRKAILNQEAVIAQAQVIQQAKKKEIAEKKDELAQKAVEIDRNHANQNKAKADREVTAATFAQNMADHDEAVKVVAELLENMKKDGDFIAALGNPDAKETAYTKHDQYFKDNGKLTESDVAAQERTLKGQQSATGVSIFNPNSFLQTAVAESAFAINKDVIEQLLNRIHNSLIASGEKYAEDEAASIAEFNDLMRKLQTQEQTLVDEQVRLEKDLKTTEAELENAIEVEKKTTQEKAQTEGLLKNNIEQCNAKKAHYENETSRRSEEISTIDEVNSIIKERVATMKAYLRARAEAAGQSGEAAEFDDAYRYKTSSIADLTNKVQSEAE